MFKQSLITWSQASTTFKLVVASMTKENSKGSSQFPVANNVPSLSLKFIGKSILEGALFAPTTFETFESIVALTLFADCQSIVDLFLIPYHEGACALPITHYSASEGDTSLSSASNKSITFSLTTIHV
jgi:hypothetical protein